MPTCVFKESVKISCREQHSRFFFTLLYLIKSLYKTLFYALISSINRYRASKGKSNYVNC